MAYGILHKPVRTALISSTDAIPQPPHIDTTEPSFFTLNVIGRGKALQVYEGEVPIEPLQRAFLGVDYEKYEKIQVSYGAEVLAMCAPLMQPKEDLLKRCAPPIYIEYNIIPNNLTFLDFGAAWLMCRLRVRTEHIATPICMTVSCFLTTRSIVDLRTRVSGVWYSDNGCLSKLHCLKPLFRFQLLQSSTTFVT